MGEKGDGEADLREGRDGVFREIHEVASFRDPAPARKQPIDDGHESGYCDHREDARRPERGSRTDQPAGHEGEEGRRRKQSAPQIVEHLPAPDRQKAGTAQAAFRIRRDSEDPGKQLPVTAGPTMLACGSDLVLRREVFDQFDVGHERRPHEDSRE